MSSQHLLPNSAHVLSLAEPPLESPFWSQLGSVDAANRFIDAIDTACKGYSPLAQNSFRNVLDKLLAQRDLYQAYSLVTIAQARADPERHLRAEALLQSLGRLLEHTLFEQAEYAELLSLKPKQVPKEFTQTLNYSLDDNYLPLAAIRPDFGWLRLENRGKPFRHFTHYRGRSFVTVYVTAARRNLSEIQAMRRQIYQKYGENLHVTSVTETVPSGFQTMLVRTLGVLLADGTYKDSSWSEEVILRVFKYATPQLDLSTSDFSGTLFYRYRLSRGRLLADPTSFGLVRVRDDDEQFFGFHGDVPDLRNAYSNSTTTMRVSCISCHAELFYGVNTVFSLERSPAWDKLNADNEIWLDLGSNTYQLRTPEFIRLAQLIGWHIPSTKPRQ